MKTQYCKRKESVFGLERYFYYRYYKMSHSVLGEPELLPEWCLANLLKSMTNYNYNHYLIDTGETKDQIKLIEPGDYIAQNLEIHFGHTGFRLWKKTDTFEIIEEQDLPDNIKKILGIEIYRRQLNSEQS